MREGRKERKGKERKGKERENKRERKKEREGMERYVWARGRMREGRNIHDNVDEIVVENNDDNDDVVD